ncbi:MAG: hypothetical protein IJG16_04455, partial [Clostridia bacterium]|nr:hypothetical protein [Clostridia bacterium]
LLTSELLFWIALIGFLLWLISLVFFVIISWQIKKYQLRHQRNNEIINESIETFTGFIDAKDQYTNGHSKRVAVYTKLIAQEMGFEGEGALYHHERYDGKGYPEGKKGEEIPLIARMTSSAFFDCFAGE